MVGSALVPGTFPVWRCQLGLRSLYNRYEDNRVGCRRRTNGKVYIILRARLLVRAVFVLVHAHVLLRRRRFDSFAFAFAAVCNGGV